VDKHTATAAIVTTGFELAKNVFQLHGVDSSGDVVFRPAAMSVPAGGATDRSAAGRRARESPCPPSCRRTALMR